MINFSTSFETDIGFIIVQTTVRSSASLINYGPIKAEVKLKKPENKSDLTKAGIFVEFKDNKSLFVGNKMELQIICQPKQERYKKRCTNIEYKIYIEV